MAKSVRDRTPPGRRFTALRRSFLVAVMTSAVLVGGAPASPAALVSGAPASPAALVEPVTSYVALGDSYTAGPGIPFQKFRPAGCARSDHNYPHLLARRPGIPRLRDVSCSGAQTVHLTSPQRVAGGVNPPQLDALDAGTRLVTVGISGNDIGFAEILRNCFSPVPVGTPCQRRYVAGGQDRISARIAQTAPRVAAVIAAIHRRSPRARVLVVGYPSILPDRGPGCWPVMPVTAADVPYLRAKNIELNAMLAKQAAANGATFVDTYTPSVGHDACALPGRRWVEPVVPVSPAAPVHPNAAGMAGIARAVLATVGAPSSVSVSLIATRA
ncbi:MAG: SGNH/GDSL hydrolase family protein [Actinomycetota bacterium]|nr:SGNH/GDSL hydrolase family protein [Actinomycetota bacterium]